MSDDIERNIPTEHEIRVRAQEIFAGEREDALERRQEIIDPLFKAHARLAGQADALQERLLTFIMARPGAYMDKNGIPQMVIDDETVAMTPSQVNACMKMLEKTHWSMSQVPVYMEARYPNLINEKPPVVEEDEEAKTLINVSVNQVGSDPEAGSTTGIVQGTARQVTKITIKRAGDEPAQIEAAQDVQLGEITPAFTGETIEVEKDG